MSARSSLPLVTPASTGPLSSVTRQPPTPQTTTPESLNHRECSTCQLQLHSGAATKTQVGPRTSPRRSQRNIALQILVKCSRFSYGSPCDSHDVFRNTRCCTHGLKPKGSNAVDPVTCHVLLFDSFRSKQFKQFFGQQILPSHGGAPPEAGLPAAVRSWSGHSGSDQQCGPAGVQPRVPAWLWGLQPHALPGSWLVFTGDGSITCHMRSTGQASCVSG